MQLNIPDELLNRSHLTVEELKLELSLVFYQRNSFTLGQASSFAGLHQMEFQKKLKERNIALHYDIDSLMDDMQIVNEP